MQSRRLGLAHLAIFLCLVVFTYSTSFAGQKDGLLKVHFFDIGQGDAIFVETPSGNQVLIDGGPDDTVLSKLGEVMPFYDRSIDLVFVSHPHSDHISGLISVLERYDVDKVIQAKESYDSPQFVELQKAVAAEGDDLEAVTGSTFDFGDGVILEVIHPFESVAGTSTKTPHNDSVVLMLYYQNTRVLLTGDMEASLERKLISAGLDLDADILKIGHHGSKTSSTEEFLKAVTPEVAVIQVGEKNKYGHPSKEVTDRLKSGGIKYFRNDMDGDVKIISDGLNFKVTAY